VTANDFPRPAPRRAITLDGMSSTTSHRPVAPRILVSLVALATVVGPYAADWNATHIHNPTWPPHAKFHNAQTMLLGLALGACSLFFAWRRAGDARPRFRVATLFAALYWITQLGSIAFPGTAFVDPERAGTGLLLGVPAQVVISVVSLTLLGVALAIEGRTPAEG
jgi:hypothetical protein